MREIARRLGVRAPSLYFHVEGRDDLLRLLTTAGLRELGEMMAAADSAPTGPGPRLHAMADAYASFASASPQLFTLIFGPCPEERRAEDEVAASAAAPLLDAVAELVPPEDVLDVSQAFWSLVHGYTTLALSEQFRMGGDPRRAIHRAVDYLLAGIGASKSPQTIAEPPPVS